MGYGQPVADLDRKIFKPFALLTPNLCVYSPPSITRSTSSSPVSQF